MQNFNNGEHNHTYNYQPQKKENTGLIIAVSVLGVMVMVGIVIIALLMIGIFTFGKSQNAVKQEQVVSVESQVWEYSEEEVQDFVSSALIAFVDGINRSDSSYISQYFSGQEAEQELQSHNQIDGIVFKEEILSLNCHTVQRISDSRVTCIRDSVIRVVYNNGTVQDISETYRYTIDLSNGQMSIVELEAL